MTTALSEDTRVPVQFGLYMRIRARLVKEYRDLMYPLETWLYMTEQDRQAAMTEIQQIVTAKVAACYRLNLPDQVTELLEAAQTRPVGARQ